MASIFGMQFGLITDQKARAHGVVNVTEPALHAKGVPRANGPTDVRFGSCSRLNPCGTCKETIENCSTHPGYIELPLPLQHVGVLDHCVKFFNMHCFNCSRFLKPDLELPPHVNTPKKKVAFYYEETKKARGWKRNPLMCPCCGLPQPTIRVEEPFFKLEFYDDALAKHFGEDVLDEVKPQRSREAAKKKQQKKKKKNPKMVTLERRAEKLRSALAAAGIVKDDADDEDDDVVDRAGDELTQVLGEIEDMITAEAPPLPTEEELADRAARRARYDEFARRFIDRPFSNWDAYNVLRGISAEDLARLGINAEHTHPSGMMLLSLVVPGISVRPTVAFEEGSKRPGYHLLTKKLSEIVKLVRTVKLEAENAKIDLSDPFHVADYPDDLNNAIVALAFAVSTYLLKDKTKIKIKLSQYAARAHARFQALAQNLQGKRGRFRNTCMGKRVDFCFRAVVTTNPDADIDVVGIPRVLARRLTVPIRISANNRQQVIELMRSGEVKQLVDERTGDMIDVTDANRDALVIMDGMIAERYLTDGDYVVINRQPTLHRPSFMSYRVKLHDDRTIKLPPPGTIPFNADHDGDEMNGHVPQTLEARTEVIELMSVTNHMMHPRANKPSMGLIQDALASGNLISQQATLLTETDAMQLLACVWYSRDADPALPLGSEPSRRTEYMLPPPAIEWPVRRWTGKQLISEAIPRITMNRPIKNRPQTITEDDPLLAADGHLLIHDGELLRGTLCKQTLGNTAGSIGHFASIYLSNQASARTLSDMQRVLNKFLICEGFSIGIRDCVCSPEIHAKVNTILLAAERHIAALETTAAEVPDDAEVRDVAELKIQETLQSALTMVGNVVRATLGPDNMFNLMSVIAGSKGSPFNMAQVMGLVGQTFVCGRRPVADGSDRVLPNAPLPHQPPLTGRAALMSLGLIVRSYLTGMTPAEAFLHNMGGREGLVDTAAKTSGTGYGQRRLVKAMEGTVVATDGSVRHTNGVLFQQHFGNDGLDQQKTVRVMVPSLMLSDTELRARCVADADDTTVGADTDAFDAAFGKLIEVRQRVRRARITAYMQNLAQNVDMYLPFDVQRLIDIRRARCGCLNVRLASSDLVEIEAMVDRLCVKLEAELPSSTVVYHLRDELSSGRLQKHHRVCRACAVGVCREAGRLHREARMHVGESVGCNSAISLGEPQSQLTFNSFHFAGTANAGLSYGVPRFRELIAASKNMATPAMTLPLKPGLGEAAAQMLARCLPYTQLQNIILSCDPVYEPDLCTTHVVEDAAMVADHRPFLEHVQADASHWVIRFVLSKMRATARSLEPAGVADLIQNEISDGGIVISADANADVWAIRVYMVDVGVTVEHALQRSLKSGTTKAAAKRASTQRPSLSASKRRRKFPDLSDMTASEYISVPLHEYDPHIGTTTHTPRAVIERKVVEYARDDLLKTRVCGVRDITMARVRPVTRTVEGPDGAMRNITECTIDVRGCNIPECAKIAMADRPRILSNNVMEIYNTMGITAAAHTLFYELRECLAGAGTRVDERLIQLLVSHMCHGGFVMPISRHGLNRLARHGVLTKAMFEETIEMVFEAAVYGSFDGLKGVSENIFIGRKARMGTAIGETLVMHDGKLEPALKPHTRLAAATTETRVLCSAITEERSLPSAAATDDDVLLWNEPGLNSVLRSAPLPGGPPTIESGLPPMPPCASDAPFRPSSPTLIIEKLMSTAASRRPFRPSSPVLVD